MTDENMEENQAFDGRRDAAESTDGQPDNPPQTLEDAFRLVRENERSAATADVGEQAGSTPAVDAGRGTGDGGSPAVGDDVDDTAGQAASAMPTREQRLVQQPQQRRLTSDQLIDNIGSQSQYMVDAELQRRGKRKYTLNDLYRRDEQTGRVTFEDPDNPNGPGFQSRVEAMQYVNAYNQNYDMEREALINEVQAQIVDSQKDVIALLDFAPTYDAMPPLVKQCFDAMIDPYARTDKNGITTFPGVKFNEVALQAINMAKVFEMQQQQRQPQQQQQQQAQPKQKTQQQKGPALDLKGGGGSASDHPEPKTIAEALKIVNEEKAAQRKAERDRKGRRQ